MSAAKTPSTPVKPPVNPSTPKTPDSPPQAALPNEGTVSTPMWNPAAGGEWKPTVEREEEVTVMELTLSDLHTLSSLLSFNIQSPADLISRVRRLSTISVDGAEVRLEDGLVTRLKSRALSQWGPEWIARTVKDQLHSFVGW